MKDEAALADVVLAPQVVTRLLQKDTELSYIVGTDKQSRVAFMLQWILERERNAWLEESR